MELRLLLLAVLLGVAAAGVAAGGGDLDLLTAFMYSLPSSAALGGWNPTQGACAFPGAGCKSGRVVSLSITGTVLSVDFRSVAANLLPLGELEVLSLRGANVSGSLAPPNGSSCGGKLAQLDLSGNGGLRGSVDDAAALVAACGGLRVLNLSRDSVGDPAVEKASGGATADAFAGMDALDLSFNSISGMSDLLWILSAGAGLPRRLDLSGNRIRGAFPEIANCSGLQYLNLSVNNLSGEVPAGVLSGCRGLLALNLSNNRFDGELPHDLAALTSLTSLSLANNNFTGELPSFLAAMEELRILDLSFNYLNGSVPGSVLIGLPFLEVLDLSSNLLSGTLNSPPCSAVLRELYLQDNFLLGPIPDSIGDCSSLVTLDLSLNFINGSLPASLGSLSELRDLIMWQNTLEGEIPASLADISSLENLILDYNGLTGGIPPGLVNCTALNWISLASNNLSGPIPSWLGQLDNLAILKLGNNSFSGPIPPELGDCKSLVWLDLNNNQLNGSIPSELAKQSGKMAVGLFTAKWNVYLRNDDLKSECRGTGSLLEFGGVRTDDLNRLPSKRLCNFTHFYIGSTQATFSHNGSMIFLDLSYNSLDGGIPPLIGTMFYLMIMNLGHNQLTGIIPPELGNLAHIAVLDLSHNELEGPIPPSFGMLSLSEIDLSNNRLNGSIPELGSLATFPAYRYENNSGLCGIPLPKCSTVVPNSGKDNGASSGRARASLAGNIAMGLLFSLFCIVGLFMVVLETHRRRKKREDQLGGSSRDICIDSRSHSGGPPTISNWKLSGTNAFSINLATFEKPLQKLTLADLIEATNGFHADSLIGSGGFGDVYKAQLRDGRIVAIKKLIHISGQGDREFMAEMETIGKIKHRNLVPLLGYCKVGEERLLVYEYMKYGSLEDVLHDRKKLGIKLNWVTRRKIAVGAARGLAFLHHNCFPHIIHRDMKSSNVLLDDQLEARVSDFGMARMMNAIDTHLTVSTLAGTPGYVPPEYYQSCRCTTRGDVYSYGVVLLELLTGRPPTDSIDFGEDNNLVGWVKQCMKPNPSSVFDPELLQEDPTLEQELREHLKIACMCLEDLPSRRPKMLQVMAMFKEIQAGSTVDSKSSMSVTTASFTDDMGSLDTTDMSLKEVKEE